jgi:hypothetical protein
MTEYMTAMEDVVTNTCRIAGKPGSRLRTLSQANSIGSWIAGTEYLICPQGKGEGIFFVVPWPPEQ